MPGYFRHLLFLPLLLIPCAPAPGQDAPAEKPNIIFIMADDLGYEALSCYGNDINKTPHLDKLAQQGMRFTHAYATPLCTPTRAQVMTGKYNHRNYIGFGLFDKNEKTFGDYMKQAGYVTGITGKWQLLGNKKQRDLAGGKTGARPEEVGFDNYCLWQVEELGSRYKNPTVTVSTGTKTYPEKYGPDMFAEFALDFIRENRDRPFFLYYPMVLTHAPFQPTPGSPAYAAMKPKGTDDPAYFKDQVEYMDKIVGMIADQVTTLGLSQKTLIIFTGDNGTGRPVVSTVNGAKITGAKGRTTRYGTNVPLIAHWKGKIKPGQVNENLIDFTDFLPTFMELAGAKLPEDHPDGHSFFRQLLNEKTKPRDWVFCYYEPRWKNEVKEIWANTKTWKLYIDGRFYNISKDPEELNPLPDETLSEEAKKTKATLRAVIEKKMSATKAPN